MVRFWRDGVPFVAVGLAVWAVVINGDKADDVRDLARGNKATLAKVTREGIERRDQTCTVFERQHLSDVQDLRRTYRYLLQLTPAERGQTINRFVIAGLPRTERDARTDTAPAYCDQPGVKAERLWRQDKKGGKPPIGLREPDPKVPKRPAALRSHR